MYKVHHNKPYNKQKDAFRANKSKLAKSGDKPNITQTWRSHLNQSEYQIDINIRIIKDTWIEWRSAWKQQKFIITGVKFRLKLLSAKFLFPMISMQRTLQLYTLRYRIV